MNINTGCKNILIDNNDSDEEEEQKEDEEDNEPDFMDNLGKCWEFGSKIEDEKHLKEWCQNKMGGMIVGKEEKLTRQFHCQIKQCQFKAIFLKSCSTIYTRNKHNHGVENVKNSQEKAEVKMNIFIYYIFSIFICPNFAVFNVQITINKSKLLSTKIDGIHGKMQVQMAKWLNCRWEYNLKVKEFYTVGSLNVPKEWEWEAIFENKANRPFILALKVKMVDNNSIEIEPIPFILIADGQQLTLHLMEENKKIVGRISGNGQEEKIIKEFIEKIKNEKKFVENSSQFIQKQQKQNNIATAKGQQSNLNPTALIGLNSDEFVVQVTIDKSRLEKIEDILGIFQVEVEMAKWMYSRWEYDFKTDAKEIPHFGKLEVEVPKDWIELFKKKKKEEPFILGLGLEVEVENKSIEIEIIEPIPFILLEHNQKVTFRLNFKEENGKIIKIFGFSEGIGQDGEIIKAFLEKIEKEKIQQISNKEELEKNRMIEKGKNVVFSEIGNDHPTMLGENSKKGIAKKRAYFEETENQPELGENSKKGIAKKRAYFEETENQPAELGKKSKKALIGLNFDEIVVQVTIDKSRLKKIENTLGKLRVEMAKWMYSRWEYDFKTDAKEIPHFGKLEVEVPKDWIELFKKKKKEEPFILGLGLEVEVENKSIEIEIIEPIPFILLEHNQKVTFRLNFKEENGKIIKIFGFSEGIGQDGAIIKAFLEKIEKEKIQQISNKEELEKIRMIEKGKNVVFSEIGNDHPTVLGENSKKGIAKKRAYFDETENQPAELGKKSKKEYSPALRKWISNEENGKKDENLKIGKQQELEITNEFLASVKNEKCTENLKLKRILNLWDSGHGVILLHIFYNIHSDEALIREGAMIEAIDVANLTNIQRSSFNGIFTSWNTKQITEFGTLLLHKAHLIFQNERCRPIFEADVTAKKNPNNTDNQDKTVQKYIYDFPEFKFE